MKIDKNINLNSKVTKTTSRITTGTKNETTYKYYREDSVPEQVLPVK
jgi:hypothetical protein